MAAKTTIEWTNRTWSPWEGCTKVSPGCEHCYAAGMNRWLHKGENWGPGAPRLEFSDAHWDKLNRWNDAAAKKGEQPKVFPSMCDPLDNEAHAGLRDRFWHAIQNTPSLTWLVLTKRIGNAQKMLPQAWLKNGWPKNLWLGATVVNQMEADRDIPKLLQVPARVRFLSIEPMLGPIDLTRIDICGHTEVYPLRGTTGCEDDDGNPLPDIPALNWVICGGESGPGARPMEIAWARSLAEQCKAAGVAFHMKQLGAQPRGWCVARLHVEREDEAGLAADYCDLYEASECSGSCGRCAFMKDKKGGDMEEWPEDLRIREFPLLAEPALEGAEMAHIRSI